jgi:hypothetical protein
MRWFVPTVIAATSAIAACGGTPGAGGGGDDAGGGVDAAKHDAPGGGGMTGPADVYAPAITSVVVEIDYETGNAPYTGAIVGFGDTFDIAIANIDRVFSHQKMLTIPRVLSAMEDIGPVDDEELTAADVLMLAAAHRNRQNTPTEMTYYILFVSGHFADANGPNPNILGVSIGANSHVIVMFKDVIRSTDSVLDPNTVRYVEQSTIVHELGHALGLVDNGVAMAAPHRDLQNGPHCDNDKCVMYWLNEGATEATQFALQHVLTNNSILFDAACLADVDALTGGP